ncbi:MAG: isoprenyl transferase [Rickettsiales bacterium]|jgi:undecaprenyl diphosphate synthase|nr:isoprenyl transferase [Rickettsiales bacterium]
MKNKLKHIAIIMDGNSRWAAKHGLSTAMGHKQGAEAARKTLISCLKLKIPYLTLYTFSSENWHRDPREVNDLMELLKFYLSNELNLLVEQKVSIKIIGDKSKFSEDLRELIDKCEEETKNNTRLYLQIALSYGAREEIINAQKKLCSDLICGKINKQDINEDLFSSYLYTDKVPDPDLLIRTSGEHRISNFLLWQIAYSELYFTKTLWPDFNSTHLRKAINNYYKRERRYGL